MIGVMKNNFTAFHIPIESPTPTIEHATKDPFRFLNYTGLLFNRQSLPVTYFWQVARSLILTVSCFSLFSVVLYHTIVYSKLSIKHASYYLVCNWHLQACFNVILIHYWQCTGQWSSQLISVYQSNKTKRVFKRIGWLMVTLNFMIIGFLISVHFARHFDNKYSVIFSFDQIFENPLFSNLARLISFYTIVIFFVCNFYFITSNAIVFEELHDFNRKFTNGLSCRSVNMIDGNSEIASVLYSFYLKHLMISNKVRALDRSWSVFAFTSAITTIPTVVFGLWTFIIRLQSSGIHILITSIELLLCCFCSALFGRLSGTYSRGNSRNTSTFVLVVVRLGKLLAENLRHRKDLRCTLGSGRLSSLNLAVCYNIETVCSKHCVNYRNTVNIPR
ncbi:hypothetical protein M3Y94_01098000 [Aphelenchoides besseyi]|nr:hypothetical protein M3Y94_01098000 [Aphelenchoides besseyi]